MRDIFLLLFTFLNASALMIGVFPPSLVHGPPVVPRARVIQDMSGTRVPVEFPVKRLIVFPLVLSTYLAVNQGVAPLVGASQVSLQEVKEKVFLERIYPDLLRTPGMSAASGVPAMSDVEEVLRFDPDAVISWWGPGFSDPLKKAGLPGVVAVQYSHPSKDYLAILKLFGDLMGHDGKVDAVLKRYQASLRRVLAGIPSNKLGRPRVLYVDDSSLGITINSYPNAWVNEHLDMAGTPSIGLGNGVTFGIRNDPEELIALDPDIIFIQCAPSVLHCTGDVYLDPRYAALDAVENRRVYRMPLYSWANPYVEEPLLLQWLVEVLYPESAPRCLRPEYKSTYQDVYHYGLREDQIDQAIFLEDNEGSAGYERFNRDAGPMEKYCEN